MILKAKRLIYSLGLVLLLGNLNSCSLEDSQPDFVSTIMAIESVDLDNEFMFGETHQITVSYRRPNDCYEFNSFSYQVNGAERTVAVINTFYFRNNCEGEAEMVEVSFDLEVTSTETYIFRFYQGQDEEGNDMFYIIEVPVVE